MQHARSAVSSRASMSTFRQFLWSARVNQLVAFAVTIASAFSVLALVITERDSLVVQPPVATFGTSGTAPSQSRVLGTSTRKTVPIGSLDAIIDGAAVGWAYDASAGSSPIIVNLYVDSTPEQGAQAAGSVIANLPRQDVNEALRVQGYHGFSYKLEDLYAGPGTHTLYVYAVNLFRATSALVAGAPKTFTIGAVEPPPIPDSVPRGYLDNANCEGISGWAYDPDTASQFIDVHIYDGSTFVTTAHADKDRPDVNQAFHITGAHGYSLPLPDRFKDGQEHTVRVYAINSTPGTNPEIDASPRSVSGCAIIAPAVPLTVSVNPEIVQQGGTYSLTATQNGQPVNGQLEYQARVCRLNNPTQCDPVTTGPWETLTGGSVTVHLSATMPTGIYNAKFRPLNQSTIPWSNEISVTVNPKEPPVSTSIKDGYVDTVNNRNIIGWTYDSTAGNKGQPVTIVVENTANTSQIYTITAQPQVVTPQAEASAENYLRQTHGQDITVEHPLGFSTDPSNSITTPGTYRIRSVTTDAGYAIQLSNAAKTPFTIGVSPSALSITVSSPTDTDNPPNNTTTTAIGSSYTLYAKQGTQNFTGLLDYLGYPCFVNQPCQPETTGTWLATDANGQVVVNVTPGFVPGVYHAKFRPHDQPNTPWSNEETVTINPAPQAPPAEKLYGLQTSIQWAADTHTVAERVAKMKELGVNAVRITADWEYIEAAKGQYDWNGLWFDDLINALTAANIKPVVIIYGSPSWANGISAATDAAHGAYVPTVEAQLTQWIGDYAQFTRALVSHYKDRVQYWELWNEPNLKEFWKPAPNITGYARWAHAIGQTIQQADAQAKVAYGSLTALDGYSQLQAGELTGKDFLSGLYDVGLRPDIVSVHPYALTDVPPDQYSPGDGISTFRDVETIKAIMDQRRPSSNNQIWITEYGWRIGAGAVTTEEIQAQYLTRSLEMIRDSWPYVTMAMWHLDYYADQFWTNYALIRNDFTIRPAGVAFRNFVNPNQPQTIQNGYVDTVPTTTDPSLLIAGWSYDSSAGSTGRPVTITLEQKDNPQVTFSKVVQPTVTRTDAAEWLRQHNSNALVVNQPLGFSIDPNTFVTTPGIYKIRSVTSNGGYTIVLSDAAKQEFTVGSAPASALSITVSSPANTTPGIATTTIAGSSYTLYAKQGTQNFTGQLDYLLRLCQVDVPTQCAPEAIGSWETVTNGQVTVNLPANFTPGIFNVKFRPHNAANTAWSNEISVTVTPAATAQIRGVFTPPVTSGTIELLGDTNFTQGLRAIGSCTAWQGDGGTVEGLPTGLHLGNCTGYRQAPSGYTIRTLPDTGTPTDQSKSWHLGEGYHVGPLTIPPDINLASGEDLQIYRMEVNSRVAENSASKLWLQSFNNLGLTQSSPAYNTKLAHEFISDRQGKVSLYANTKNYIRNVATDQGPNFAYDTWPHYTLVQELKQLMDLGQFSAVDLSATIDIPFVRELPGWTGPYKSAATQMIVFLRNKSNPFRGLWLVNTVYSQNPSDYQQALGGDQWGIALYRANVQDIGGPLTIGGAPRTVRVNVLENIRKAIALNPALGQPSDYYMAMVEIGNELVGYHEWKVNVSNVSLKGTLGTSAAQAVQNGYVDVATGDSIFGWSYDSTAGSTGQTVSVVVEKSDNPQVTFTKVVQPTVSRTDAATWLQSQYGAGLAITQPLGFSVDPKTFVTTPGTYKLKSVTTSGGYALAVNPAAPQTFTIGQVTPTIALTIQVSSPASLQPGASTTTQPGSSYTLYAKQGGQNFTGQLDYLSRVCQVNNPTQCGGETTGAWLTVTNGQVVANLPAGFVPGVYYAKFRPTGQSTVPWSNETSVTVSSGAPSASVQIGPDRFVVGPKETVVTKAARDAVGLQYWTDGQLGIVPKGNGSYDFYAGNSIRSAKTSGTLDNPIQGVAYTSLALSNPSANYNYASGGPVYKDPTTGKLVMIYHAEYWPGGNPEPFNSWLGMAVSTDDGATWRDIGPIIKTQVDINTHAEIGGGEYTIVADNMYVYYHDYLADGTRHTTSVAKTSLYNITQAIANNTAPAFFKYYNGSWNEPGLTGKSSSLYSDGQLWGFPSVRFNSALGKYVMALFRYGPNYEWSLYMTTSTNGLTWLAPVQIESDPGTSVYPTVVGTGPDPRAPGSSFYIYYGKSTTVDRWQTSELVRKRVTIN